MRLSIAIGLVVASSGLLVACQPAPNSSGEVPFQLRDEVVRVTQSVRLPLEQRFSTQVSGFVVSPPFAQRWRLPSIDKFAPTARWSYPVGPNREAQVVAGILQSEEGRFFCEVDSAEISPIKADKFELSRLQKDQTEALQAAREGAKVTLALSVECRSKTWSSRTIDAISG
jgi:hypothetical protein